MKGPRNPAFSVKNLPSKSKTDLAKQRWHRSIQKVKQVVKISRFGKKPKQKNRGQSTIKVPVDGRQFRPRDERSMVLVDTEKVERDGRLAQDVGVPPEDVKLEDSMEQQYRGFYVSVLSLLLKSLVAVWLSHGGTAIMMLTLGVLASRINIC